MSVERRGGVVEARERQDRDGDVDGRADRSQTGVAARGGNTGQQQIAQDVGPALVERAGVGGVTLGSVFGPRTGFGGRLSIGLFGEGARHVGDALENALHERRRGIQQQSRETVAQAIGLHLALRERVASGLVDDRGLQPRGDDASGVAQVGSGRRLGDDQHPPLVLVAHAVVEKCAGVDDRRCVPFVDAALAQRVECRGVCVDERRAVAEPA